MKSARTKEVIKKRNIFFIISSLLWIGTAAVFIVLGLNAIGSKGPSDVQAIEDEKESISILSEQAKNLLTGVTITTVIGLIAAIIIKDKLRTVIWMASTIIASIVFKSVGMYIVLVIWASDEYIFRALYLKYKGKVEINKEMDLREGNA